MMAYLHFWHTEKFSISKMKSCTGCGLPSEFNLSSTIVGEILTAN